MDIRGKRILLVEDEVIIAMMEKQELETMGYSVDFVSTGESAVKSVEAGESSYDVILMDIDLGKGKDGTQAAEEILKEHDIPVVFLSSHSEPEIVGKTEKITSYGYVLKDSSFVILDASIKMALKLFDEKVERRLAEKQVIHLKSLYASLSRINQLIMRAGTIEDLVSGVCRIAVQHGFFKLVWVGRYDARTGEIIPLGFSGEPEKIVYGFTHCAAEDGYDRCMCSSAIRQSEPCISNNLSLESGGREFDAEMRNAGIRSAAAFPVRVRGEIWGVFGVYSDEPGIFMEKEIGLLEEAAMDIGYAIGHIENEMKRVQAEKFQLLSTAVLGILNQPMTLKESTAAVLNLIRRETGFDAVGIRLKDGDDFPYFSEDGFDKDFLATENSLIRNDDSGVVCRDDAGNISLECTCGLVLSEKCGPPGENVTAAGSIWTNDSLSLSDKLHGNDPRLKPRDRCCHDGFQSIALIPIRKDQQVIGLLHINDRRKDRFTPESISFFENLTSSFAISVKRKQAESALKESEERFRRMCDQTACAQ
jgi:GAF domain-containing protein/CheY-like chemotaxis protein